MAFLRTAKALVVHPRMDQQSWSKVRTAATIKGGPNESLVAQATEILGKVFNPKDYLLTHCTLVASVDVETVGNVKLGKVTESGRKINRRWADYRITSETDEFVNNNCFPPGTTILMGDGTLKPIEEIQLGDEVMTHLGRARKVTKLYENPYDGELLVLKYRSSNERVYVTPEHPLFLYRTLENCIKCGKPLEHRQRCVKTLQKFYCGASCYFKAKKSKEELLAAKGGEFIPASQARDHLDFVAAPLLTEINPVPLTLGQARLIGYFLAEGYYASRTEEGGRRVGVCWGLHVREQHTLGKNIVDLMKQEFDVDCVVHPVKETQGINVKTNKALDAVAFFERWIRGDHAKEKTLHPDLLRAPRDIQMEILRAWFEGDGCSFDTQTETVVGDIRLAGSTASKSLASQLLLLLNRVGVSAQWLRIEHDGRKRMVVDGKQKVISDPSKKTVVWTLSCGGGWVAEMVENTYYEQSYNEAVARRGGLQKTPGLRFLNGNVLQMLESVDRVDYTGPVYNIEVEEDHSYVAAGISVHNCDAFERKVLLKSYKTLVGAQNYQEHVQVEELSKGRIIDAVARDVGKSVYIDILVATERRHTELIRDILSGRMGTLSMGSTVSHTTCTKCGNVAVDETEMCYCIKHEKGNSFLNDKGQYVRIAELCGHHTEDPTGGVNFIEGSWVATPAFTGAVLRNVIETDTLTAKAAAQIQQVLSQPPSRWTDGPRKQASDVSFRNRQSGFDFGEDVPAEDAPAAEEKPEPSKLDTLEDRVVQKMLDRVEKKITDEMDGPEKSPEDSSAKMNDSVNRNAYRAALNKSIRTASSDADLINKVAILDHKFKRPVSIALYRTALKVGSLSKHASPVDFLRACRNHLGQPLQVAEGKVLIRLGRILDLAAFRTNPVK